VTGEPAIFAAAAIANRNVRGAAGDGSGYERIGVDGGPDR
jgi:hypothetical protein